MKPYAINRIEQRELVEDNIHPMIILGVSLFLGMALLLLGLTSATWAAKKNIKDVDITQAVETELINDPVVSSHLIDVHTSKGIVTLSGSVANLLSKDRAVRRAESVKGVRSVVNRLKVKPISRSDPTIQHDVENALLHDPATTSYKIKVAVENATATLSGTVGSWIERDLCAQVAKGVKGLKAVKNNIQVDEKCNRSDSEIKSDIKHRLASDIYVDDIMINVKVKKGKVFLTGTVGSAAEKRQAMTDCWISGVTAVDVEDLNVEWRTRDKMRKKSQYVSKSNAEVKKAIQDAFLYDPRVFSFNLDVAVDNGAVMLTGVVTNLKAKRAAAQDARDTKGVMTVENLIKVRPATPSTDPEIEQKIRDALEQDRALHRYKLIVSVANQKAYLHGSVSTHHDKSHAADLASRVAGVVEVENYIEVIKPWVWKSDDRIKKDVEHQFFWNPFVDSDDITVTVKDGEVTLTGTAHSIFEADKAVTNAFEGGAKTVRARLKLADGTEFHRYYPRDYDYVRYDY